MRRSITFRLAVKALILTRNPQEISILTDADVEGTLFSILKKVYVEGWVLGAEAFESVCQPTNSVSKG
jgi:hypothetical protein